MLYDRFGQPLYTVQEASNVNKQFDEFEHVKQVANELYNEWETYSYGIPKKGKIENVPSAEYYEKHYHFLSPEEFEKYGGGVCWDYVEWGVNFLKDKDVKVRTFYIWTETPPNWDTHTFLVIDCGDMQRYVYVESSFKLLKGVWIHNSLDEIIDTITWNMFKCNDNARRFDKFRYVVFEYTGSHPPYGCTCRQYMDWMVNQKDIREGYAEKDKPPAGIVKESSLIGDNIMDINTVIQDIQFDAKQNIYDVIENVYCKNEMILNQNPKYVFTECNHTDIMIDYYNMLYDQNVYLNCEYNSVMESFNQIHQNLGDEYYNETAISSKLMKSAPITSVGKTLIRTVLHAIKRALKFIYNLFKSIFSKLKRNKSKHTADEACERCGFIPIKIHDKKIIRKVEVLDPKSGNTKTFDASFISKSLKIKILKNEYEIMPNDGINGSLIHANKFKLFGVEIFFKNQQFGLAKWFIDCYNVGIIKELTTIISSITNSLKSKDKTALIKDFKLLEQLIIRIAEVGKKSDDKVFKLKIDKIMEYNISIKNIADAFDTITATYDSLNNDTDQELKKIVDDNKDLFTSISFFIEKTTVGMNTLGNELSEIYKVDASYKGTCNDLKQLSRFVEYMINDGIPSIYVGYNTWYVLAYDLDNRDVYSTKNKKPRMGQTRIAFFPTKKGESNKVVKVALNTAGVRANRGEKKLYDTFNALSKTEHATLSFGDDEQHLDEILAKPIDDYNGFVSTYEKLNTDFQLYKLQSVADEMKKQIGPDGKFLKDHGLLKYAINDIHLNNIGATDNGSKWKIIDYYLY